MLGSGYPQLKRCTELAAVPLSSLENDPESFPSWSGLTHSPIEFPSKGIALADPAAVSRLATTPDKQDAVTVRIFYTSGAIMRHNLILMMAVHKSDTFTQIQSRSSRVIKSICLCTFDTDSSARFPTSLNSRSVDSPGGSASRRLRAG